ncbi:hypothetical protein G6F65_020196 [Rhizopus arrhizus]|nr:hypothetical protein G6F65_020196 [Rhizopus arrhizus]
MPATARQSPSVDADLGRRRGFRANQGWHLPERCVVCCRGSARPERGVDMADATIEGGGATGAAKAPDPRR